MDEQGASGKHGTMYEKNVFFFPHSALKTANFLSVGHRQHPSGGPLLSGSGPGQHLT